MGTIKTIAEYETAIKIFNEADRNSEREAMREENNIKDRAMASLNENVYASISNIIKNVINGTDNKVFSPSALYLALIVLGELTANETKKQILDVTMISEAESREIFKAVKDLTESLCGYANSKVSASIWVNDKLDYNDDLLKKLNRFYQVSSFAGIMGTDEMNKSIAEWVNKTTGNMLSDQINIETTPDMLLDFFTTIYFGSKWDHEFYDENINTRKFYLENGEKINCKMMRQITQAQYHEGRQFTAMTKELAGGYAAVFVLPNKGILVNELVDDSQLLELAMKGKIVTTEECDVTFAMPEFDFSSKIDLIEIMQNLGIQDAFTAKTADFSPISSEEKLYLSKAEQTTRIKMDKEGVEAASCVEMGLCELGLPPEYKKVKLTLNRPFLFFIMSHNCMPVIAGKLMNPVG